MVTVRAVQRRARAWPPQQHLHKPVDDLLLALGVPIVLGAERLGNTREEHAPQEQQSGRAAKKRASHEKSSEEAADEK